MPDSSPPHAVPNDDDVTYQFLTFTVGDETYGVDIMSVREIKGWEAVTRLPNSPRFMRGVMNLRGAIIPIFDLRARFDMGQTDAHEKHVVIIIAVGSRIIGVLVDSVSDILTAAVSAIKPPPAMEQIDPEFLNGLISVKQRMVVLLNVERLFDTATLREAEKLAS